jgi:hypothetical protein
MFYQKIVELEKEEKINSLHCLTSSFAYKARQEGIPRAHIKSAWIFHRKKDVAFDVHVFLGARREN